MSLTLKSASKPLLAQSSFASAFFGVVIYRLLLDWCYFSVLSPVYAYAGFEDMRSPLMCAVSWALTLAVIPVIHRIAAQETTVFSQLVIFSLLLLSFVPFNTLCYAGILSTKFIVLNTAYFVCLIVFSRFLSRKKIKLTKIKLGSSKFRKLLLIAASAISALVVVYVSARYTGLRFTINIKECYTYRSQAAGFNLSTLVLYALSAASVVNCIFLAYAFIERNKPLFCVLFVIQILNYSIGGHKSVLFMTFLTVLIAYFYKNEYVNLLKRLILYGLTIIVALSLLEFKLTDDSVISAIFIRRCIFVPIKLGNYYVDFFSSHAPDFFKGSFLRHFGFQTKYPNLAHIIGDVYLDNPDCGANNGLIADSVCNFGTTFFFFGALMVVLFLFVVDRVCLGLNPKLFLVFLIVVVSGLLNTFLFTCLLTHGFLAAIAVLFLIKQANKPSRLLP